MRLEETYIKRLRDLPIEQVAQRLGLKVVRGKCLCPFHPDKNPSMTFNAKTNTCKCWSCGDGKSYDTISFTEKKLNKTFREACDWLAGENAITPIEAPPAQRRVCKQYPPDLVWLSELVQHPVLIPEAKQFLEERRIDPKVVQWCGLSSTSTPLPCYRGGRDFYEAPSLLIPYRDEQGRVLSVQSRYLGKRTTEVTGSLPKGRAGGESAIPRFRFPRNAPTQIFNLPVLPMLQGYEELQICEGVSDCLAALSSGVKSIAIGSATLLRGDALAAALKPHLSHWTGSLVCYPDQDEAGEKFYQQLVRVANEMRLPLIRRQLPEGCKDFGDLWATQTQSLANA